VAKQVDFKFLDKITATFKIGENKNIWLSRLFDMTCGFGGYDWHAGYYR
jgi:hypothetical protein